MKRQFQVSITHCEWISNRLLSRAGLGNGGKNTRINSLLCQALLLLTNSAGGTSEKTQARIDLIKDLEMLPAPSRINQIAQTYIDRSIMPQDLFGDAHHLALASFHNADALLTWNCKHLANLNKIYLIRQINQELGLPTPELATPLNYLGADD